MVQSLFIADFGLAKVLDDTSKMTSTLGKGTLQYMAPEVTRNLDDAVIPYDPFKADVWSFGILLYEMLSGNPPRMTIKDVVEGAVPELSPDIKKLYPQFVPVMQSCLTLDPQQRPLTIDLLVTVKKLAIE